MISRSILLFRPLFKFVAASDGIVCGKQTIRKSHVVSYRAPPPLHSKATVIGAEMVGAAMWWWVLWHLWHEHEHITGEFAYPDPSRWSNAELGIPNDVE